MKRTHILSFVLSLVLMLGCFAGLGITVSAADTTGITVTTEQEIKDALNDKNTKKIILGADIKLSSTLSISDRTLTIDLNGYKLDRGLTETRIDFGRVIELDEAELTICDSSAGQNGMITGGCTESKGGGVYVDKSSMLTLQSGKISGNKSNDGGGGVYVNEGGKFIMEGGEISNNEALEGYVLDSDGGGIYSWAGYVTIHGGVLRNNTASGDGGAIFVDCGPDNSGGHYLQIKGDRNNPVLFEGNVCQGKGYDGIGGAICLENGKTTVSYAKFVNNKAHSYGHAIYCDTNDGTSISDCTFVNHTGNYQGVIAIDTDNVKLSNISVTDNIGRPVVSWGNDYILSGRIIIHNNKYDDGDVAPLYLDVDGDTDWGLFKSTSRLYIYDNLLPGSSIDISMRDIEEGEELVYCEGEAKATENYKYFHLTDTEYRALADDDEICAAPRGSYVEANTLNNEEPVRSYSVTFQTGDTYWSPTYNEVYINIIGDVTSTGFIKCDGDYDRNTTNTVTIAGLDVGNIQKFEVKLDSDNDWLLYSMTVEGENFTIKRWLKKPGTVISVNYNSKSITTEKGKATIETGSIFTDGGSVLAAVAIAEALVIIAVVTYIVVDKKKRVIATADGAEEIAGENDNE